MPQYIYIYIGAYRKLCKEHNYKSVQKSLAISIMIKRERVHQSKRANLLL